jgi:hypothetical protein
VVNDTHGQTQATATPVYSTVKEENQCTNQTEKATPTILHSTSSVIADTTGTNIFCTPTVAERREVHTLLRTHLESAIQSLAVTNHIVSGAIDDAITMILRHQLPIGTTVLLSSDAMTIWDVTNTRQRTRLSRVVASNTTTLILFNDSHHWLLAEIDSVTCTIMLHNSAGTH